MPRRPRPARVIEPLESRLLLSTIFWVNRAISDNFNAVYGASANAARAIVDRACADWGRVIDNFNYGDGTNTFFVSFTAADLGDGTRGETSPSIGLDNGKPQTASITLDDNGGGAGWYFDPNPGTAALPDDSEFTSLLSRFAANGPNSLGGNDFYRTAVHELGHAMGISIGNGSASIPAFNTGITDPNDSSAKIWVYNAPSGTYTYTDNGGGHVYEGPAVGPYPTFPNDLMNAGRTVGFPPPTRELITDDDALMLRDAHGYTVTLPSTINTFLTNFNTSTHQVTVNEDPNVITDTVTMQVSGSNEWFAVDGSNEFIPNSGIFSINVQTHSGLDSINLLSCDIGDPVSISNTGVTTVNLGDPAGTGMQGIKSSVSITNTSISLVNITDAGDTTARTFSLDNDGTTATLSGLGPANVSWSQLNVINVNLTGSSGADTFNILRTSENITYEGHGGADAINIGNPSNGTQSITGHLTFTNGPSFSTFHIDDSPDTTPRTVIQDTYTLGTDVYGHITGITPSYIDYKYFDTSAVILKTGSAVDTVDILRTGKSFTLDTSGGNDIVNIGAGGSTGVQGINGPVEVENNPAFSVLTVDDTGDTTARTVTVDVTGGLETISGLAPATIEFIPIDVGSATVTTGSAGDTVNVLRNSRDLTLSSAGGLDTVSVGTSAAPGVQGITGQLTITNPPSFSTVTIDDSTDTTARSASIDTSAGLTTVTGLAPGAIRWKTSDISFSGGVTLTAGSAADTLAILRVSNPLKISNGGGRDAITIGNATHGVQSITGTINITNPPSFSSIVVDDSADTTGRVVTIAPGSITGLAPAAITWANTDVSTVTIDGGSGGNSFTASAFSNATTINGGTGNDTVTLVGNAGGNLTYNGQAGADSLVVADTAAAGQAYTLTPTSLTRGLLAATFATIELVLIEAGPGADTFEVNGTNATTPVAINAGAGTDTIDVNETASSAPVTILPSSGNDVVTVNSDGTGAATAVFNGTQTIGSLTVGTGGTAALAAGSGTVLMTKALLLSIGGTLDVNDNAFVYDYTGATPITTIRTAIQIGYDGGAWDGTGITSSSAKADAAKTHALGYAEASMLGITQYGGLTVDSTSILVKYTYMGDANMDGKLNGDDFALADRGKLKASNTWVFGDFNYNGTVTQADIDLLTAAFAIVSEPAGVATASAPASAPVASSAAATVIASSAPTELAAAAVAPAAPQAVAVVTLGKKKGSAVEHGRPSAKVSWLASRRAAKAKLKLGEKH